MTSPVNEAFRDRCPRCGYALVGLPAQGVCPECGRAYEPSTIYLYGRAAGQFANLANAGWASFLTRLIVPGFVAYIGLVLLRHGWLITGAWIIAIALADAGPGLWRRFTTRGAGPVQIGLAEWGFFQLDASSSTMPFERTDHCESCGWSRVNRILVEPVTAGRYRLRFSWRVWFSRKDRLDAVVELPDALAPKLRSQLLQWHRDA